MKLHDDSFHRRTKVLFDEDARKEVLSGMELVHKAIGCTLGPKGSCVLIRDESGKPFTTKDGATVGRYVRPKDKVHALGADLIKEASERTNESAGDGTTTSTVIAYELCKICMRLLSAGHSARELKRGMEHALDDVCTELKNQTRHVDSIDSIKHIATISGNNDKSIGDLIAQAMEKVGKEGIITVEDAKGMQTSLEVVEGMQFDRGFLSPYFVNDPEKMQCAYDDVLVFASSRKLASARELIPLLEDVRRSERPLLIIADELEGEVMQLLLINRTKGNFPVVAVRSPAYGSLQYALLEDVCTLAGTVPFDSSTGTKLDSLRAKDLGRIKRVVVNARSTSIVAELSAKVRVDERLLQLRTQILDPTLNPDDRTDIKTRISKLSAGAAIIKVGGATEVEMTERKHRIEDALHATHAAVEEGILPGGGASLVRARKVLQGLQKDVSESFSAGTKAVWEVCAKPLEALAASSGAGFHGLLERLTLEEGTSYDVLGDKIVDAFESGILDPSKVTRSALENAVSVATTFVSLSAVVVEENDE